MNFYKKLISIMFVSSMLLTSTAFASETQKSGTIVIDETQVSLIIGGDMGGGVLRVGDESRSFKTEGLKIGGLGVNKIHLIGDLYNLKNIADFAGVYASFEMGATLGYASKNALWLKNTKGVKLNMKSSSGEGVALSLAAEGFKISMD